MKKNNSAHIQLIESPKKKNNFFSGYSFEDFEEFPDNTEISFYGEVNTIVIHTTKHSFNYLKSITDVLNKKNTNNRSIVEKFLFGDIKKKKKKEVDYKNLIFSNCEKIDSRQLDILLNSDFFKKNIQNLFFKNLKSNKDTENIFTDDIMKIIYTTFSKKKKLKTVMIDNLKSPSNETPETLLTNIIDFTNSEETPTAIGKSFPESTEHKNSTEEKRMKPRMNIQYTGNYQNLINGLAEKKKKYRNIDIEFEELKK